MPYFDDKRTDARKMEYTVDAKKTFSRVVRDPYFLDRDPELILDALTHEIRSISFGAYLLRYLVRKYGGDGVPEGDAEQWAVDCICGEFSRRGVPPSFTPTTARIRNLAGNWLKQGIVKRNVVLLLGFGLGMSAEDVNAFLAKALKEPMLDPKDPFEAICWFCYRYRLPYERFEKLWEKWRNRPTGNGFDRELMRDSTVYVRHELNAVCTTEQLEGYLSRLKIADGSPRQSVAARRQFGLLYEQVRAFIASEKTEMERDQAENRAARRGGQLSRNDRLYDFQKLGILRRERANFRTWKAEEITPADVESHFYAAVPKDRNGNLIPMKLSGLSGLFPNRMTRQHISDIQEGRILITRYDVVTLSFFRMAGRTDEYPSARQRYGAFVRETNKALSEGDMPPLYVANPYECFLLMCSLAEDPLGCFADVWDQAYHAADSG